MLNTNTSYLAAYKTSSRELVGSVTCQLSSSQLEIKADNNLISFQIEKTTPKGKLFGFAVSQKITVEALGILDGIQKGDTLIPTLGIKGESSFVDLPHFYVDSIEFNKVNQTTTITGYDTIHNSTLVISDLLFTYPLTIKAYATQVVSALGGVINFETSSFNNFTITEAPNFDGYESLQSVLGSIAEATGTICYVSSGNQIKFRRISAGAVSADTLTPADYFDLTFGESVTLTEVASGTELGDNLTAGSKGFTQVLWENPFLVLREDIANLLSYLFIDVNGISTTGYKLTWRGCPAYEIGDCITLQEKDGTLKQVLYFNETLTYSGGLRAVSEWESVESERVEASPSSVSKVIKQTYAKVDKVNQEIDLLAKKFEDSDVGTLTEEVAQLKITTDAIEAEVKSIEETTDERVEASVNAKLSDENLSIVIQNEISNGVTSIKTETGFTFDTDGLTVSKLGAPTETLVSEDGMDIISTADESYVLQANAEGVIAKNLHAHNFLVIGESTRFEDFIDKKNRQRIGCFFGSF